MKTYRHEAKYYETDQMGIIHHSNYIRWMEEARIDMMEQMGYGYKFMEEQGVISPVLEVNCQYKNMVYFGDVVQIRAWVKEYSGVKLKVGYEMIRETDGVICTVAESSHCFLDKNGKILSLKRSLPECDAAFRKMKELGKEVDHD